MRGKQLKRVGGWVGGVGGCKTNRHEKETKIRLEKKNKRKKQRKKR